MPNIQATNSPSPSNARSESAIVVNPNNPQQAVGASKRFNNLHTYDFTLAAVYSADGGQTWNDSAAFALPPGATVMTDPAIAWDDAGNVYMVGLVGSNPPTFNTIGIAIFKSTDGGSTWSNPNLIHTSAGDDKQWVAGDTNPTSPYHGRVYAVWDDGSAMRFARTLDSGATWISTGASPVANVSLTNDSFSPEINVAANGDVYIVWIAGSVIRLLVSRDGGNSFQAMSSPASGVTTLSSSLTHIHGWPVFPGGNFRVLTVPSACVFGQTIAVAWDDFREGVSRIYVAVSSDGGATWGTGPSGRPLLAGSLPSNMQHFFPQVIADPNGVIGCSFYEFGPKPTTPLIDLIMAESFDGGATFIHFTVTDQPWDPTVGAPWAHHGDNTPIDASVTFIGDYFGIDASPRGFYPLWTDTRTGMQELWTAIVPERRCAFLVERSTLGQDEIDARRGQPRGPIVPEAFRVVVDGFTAAQLGVAGPAGTLNVASPKPGVAVVCTGNTSANSDYGPEVQRFTFHYNLDFGPVDTAFTFPGPTEFLTLNVAVAGVSASAEIELIKQPNPFILHGDPYWLSIDLRVLVVRAGQTRFGVTMGNDASAAPAFIQQVMSALSAGNGSAGGETFDGLPTDEESSSLFIYPKDGPLWFGTRVFNFALAKVHYIGLIGATNVRVFFRLFQAQSTSVAFEPSTTYRRATSNPHGHPIALAGIQGSEYVTIPCFAAPRVDSTQVSMNQQTDDPNVQTFNAIGGPEVDRFFGCWLDINQPFKADGVTPNNVLPISTSAINADGPFTDPANPPLTIQQSIVRNPHQCLVAEIAFDPVSIPIGKDPSNWDKLAQRNIAWSDIPNPGVDGSRRALSTFEIRPTPTGVLAGQSPDELMIDWGNVPSGTKASIFLPALEIADILSMADRMYTGHRLTRADDHTLECRAGGITYVPVPRGSDVNFVGLLTLDLPRGVRKGQAFHVTVRQVTNAFGTQRQLAVAGRARDRGNAPAAATSKTPRLIGWRRVLGAFQLNIPIQTKDRLLVPEERRLSVLRWIGEAIPPQNRWHAVFHRYLHQIADRVSGFGGDPGLIVSSPTGDGRRKDHPEREHDHRHVSTGKITGLIFDRFGDFEGFVLSVENGEREFFSRETEIAQLAQRAWRERLRLRVWSKPDDPRRPLTIIVLEPPAPF